MAKQTNKTNHILNLLSGNGKKKEAGDEQGLENAAPPVVPRSKTRETAEPSETTEPVEKEAQVIVDVVDEKVEEKENEELVNSINSALENELKEYEETKAADATVSEEPPMFDEDLELSHRENIVTEVENLEENIEATETVAENSETEEMGFDLGPGLIDDEPNDAEFGVLFNGPSVLTKESEDDVEITLEQEEAIETPVVEEVGNADGSEILDTEETEEVLEVADTNENIDIDDTKENNEDEDIPIEGYMHNDEQDQNVTENGNDMDSEADYDDEDDEIIPIGGVAHGPEMDNRIEEPVDVSPELEIESKSKTESKTESEAEEKLLSPDPDLDTKEPSYVTLNVMETLVDMFALEYMEKFKICTCDRCLADVKALALTKLSGKYVVVDRNAQQAMINFYEKKFKSDIIVELTKACITINENPHH